MLVIMSTPLLTWYLISVHVHVCGRGRGTVIINLPARCRAKQSVTGFLCNFNTIATRQRLGLSEVSRISYSWIINYKIMGIFAFVLSEPGRGVYEQITIVGHY